MPRFMTIYRWKPENAVAFAKQWLMLSTHPELKKALEKMKQISTNYSAFNNCAVLIYEVKDEDMGVLNMLAIHLSLVCEMETIPLVDADTHTNSFGEYLKLFPKTLA